MRRDELEIARALDDTRDALTREVAVFPEDDANRHLGAGSGRKPDPVGLVRGTDTAPNMMAVHRGGVIGRIADRHQDIPPICRLVFAPALSAR